LKLATAAVETRLLALRVTEGVYDEAYSVQRSLPFPLAILACANNNPVTGGARWDDISWLVVAGSNSEWTKV